MLQVYTDGGSRGNPGHSAYGFVVKIDGKTIKDEGGYLGVETNNFAEYTAIIKALKWIATNHEKENIECLMDSLLAASQLSGKYRVKNPKIKSLFLQVKSLENKLGKIVYKHIPRDQNKEADKLVNVALDKIIYGTNILH